jgi:hypothetical protein
MNPLSFFKRNESERNHNIEFGFNSDNKLRQLNGSEKVGYREYMANDYLAKAKRQHRRSNPIAANQADIVYWVLYDRFFLAAAQAMPAKFVLFSVPQGQTITTGGTTYTKSKQDTNMTQVSTLEAPQWMNTIGAGIYFGGNMLKGDIDGIINTSYLEYWVTAKVYAEGPLQIFPAGAGLSGYTDQTGQATWTNGVAQASNVFDLRLPGGIHLGMGKDDSGNDVAITTDGLMGITILQSQTFHVDIKTDSPSGTAFYTTPYTLASSTATPTVGSGANVMGYLYGILSRGVQ